MISRDPINQMRCRYGWRSTEWTECRVDPLLSQQDKRRGNQTALCGGGVQTREVYCVQANENLLSYLNTLKDKEGKLDSIAVKLVWNQGMSAFQSSFTSFQSLLSWVPTYLVSYCYFFIQMKMLNCWGKEFILYAANIDSKYKFLQITIS